MKKVLLLSSVIIILGLTGCSNKYFNDWFSSEQNETDKMCQQIIEACKQQDSEKLKSLFSEESKKNIENLDTEISAFFDYIEGSIQSFEGDCASSSESNYGTRTPVAGLKRPMAMSSCVTSPPPISGPSPGRSCLGPPMSGPFCGRWIPPPKNTRRLHGSSMPKRWSVWVWKNQHSKKKKERK